MDVVLEYLDDQLLDGLYPPSFSRESILRQFISLYTIAVLGGYVLYFSFSTLSYLFLFDKTLTKHPQWLKNQVRKEIWLSVTSMPAYGLLTVPWFLGEVRGYSRLYREIHTEELSDWIYLTCATAGFLLFTDMGVYWIHRWLHHPALYSRLHKPHHYWKIPSPFASFAFHPVDGYLQSVPYHLYAYLVPLPSLIYLFCFTAVQIWTIGIHDGNYMTDSEVVNGCAHHTVHHLQFHYNYGQYFTFWDRIGGSYRRPVREDTIKQTKPLTVDQPLLQSARDQSSDEKSWFVNFLDTITRGQSKFKNI